MNNDVSNKLDKWMSEFSARENFIEDKNLFDALYDCICWRINSRELSEYLQENKEKFVVDTNVDLLICHALDCYHAMEYLFWSQNGRLNRDRPMVY